MNDSYPASSIRIGDDARSGTDTRSDAEKQIVGERRSGVDRRTGKNAFDACAKPPEEQLALFARRLRRALASERGREFFGVARGEYDFSIYPDVLRTIEWLERLGKSDNDPPRSANQGKITIRKSVSL